jgi:hypothetical protein
MWLKIDVDWAAAVTGVLLLPFRNAPGAQKCHWKHRATYTYRGYRHETYSTPTLNLWKGDGKTYMDQYYINRLGTIDHR